MPLTVLVADDDDAVREMVELVLTLEGFEVHAAADGPAALRLAAEVVPDVAVLDVMMPGLHGLDVASRLRAAPATARIPIVFCTALPPAGVVGADAGARGASYVAKPFTRDVLVAAVRRVTAPQQVTPA